MNKDIKRWIIYFSAVSLFLMPQKNAGAVVATEGTQILNNIQLIISVSKQAAMVLNQAQMIQNQLKSLEKYPQGEWGDVMNVIRNLESVIRQGQALSYTLQNLESTFKEKFPGYQSPTDYVKAYQIWSGTTLDSIRSSLVSAGLQRNDFDSESNLLKRLNSMSDNAAGQTQAIQAGNQIANQSVVQMMLLRKLMMDQMQAQVSFMAYEVNKEAADKAVADNFFNEIPYEKGKGQKY